MEIATKSWINCTVKSTEELCALLSSFNENVETVKKDHDGANYFVASMDVSSLFPSLKTESTAKEIKETVLESEITVNDVNWRELGIFLRKKHELLRYRWL